MREQAQRATIANKAKFSTNPVAALGHHSGVPAGHGL